MQGWHYKTLLKKQRQKPLFFHLKTYQKKNFYFENFSKISMKIPVCITKNHKVTLNFFFKTQDFFQLWTKMSKSRFYDTLQNKVVNFAAYTYKILVKFLKNSIKSKKKKNKPSEAGFLKKKPRDFSSPENTTFTLSKSSSLIVFSAGVNLRWNHKSVTLERSDDLQPGSVNSSNGRCIQSSEA